MIDLLSIFKLVHADGIAANSVTFSIQGVKYLYIFWVCVCVYVYVLECDTIATKFKGVTKEENTEKGSIMKKGH